MQISKDTPDQQVERNGDDTAKQGGARNVRHQPAPCKPNSRASSSSSASKSLRSASSSSRRPPVRPSLSQMLRSRAVLAYLFAWERRAGTSTPIFWSFWQIADATCLLTRLFIGAF